MFAPSVNWGENARIAGRQRDEPAFFWRKTLISRRLESMAPRLPTNRDAVLFKQSV
jgi:hypothetical protein